MKCKTKKSARATWEMSFSTLINHKTKKGIISDNSVRKAVSDIRKGLKAQLGNSRRHKQLRNWLLLEPTAADQNAPKLGIVVAGKEIANRSNQAKSKALSKRLSTKKTLTNSDGLINLAETFLRSYDWRELAIGLAILTGRRTVEIMKTGNLTVQKGLFMRFSGQAKSKGNNAYIIPVLASPSKIKAALKRLRDLKDLTAVSEEKVNTLCQKPLDRLVAKVMASYTNDPTSMHDLRKIYARLSVTWFLGSEELTDGHGQIIRDETLMIKHILGHQNTESGLNYRNWDIE